jgi:hypothetical protein
MYKIGNHVQRNRFYFRKPGKENNDSNEAHILQKGDVIMKKTIILLIITVLFSTYAYAEDAKNERGILSWTERVHLSGTLEGDFTWTKHSDITEKGSDSSTDLFISTVELGVEVEFTDWIMGNILFLAEDLGTDDETDVTVDEALITLQKEEFPVYLVVGKRALPFGVFENHLVADPMTQDAYETNRVGATLGFTGPLGLDLSATLYKGEEMISHLFESELFDSDAIARQGDSASDDVSSYVISASIEPLPEKLVLFGGFISEPGTGERNNTAGVGFNLVIGGLRVDGEYMKAISREKYTGFSSEFKEGVFSLSAAYELIIREREVIGGALFAERKAHVVSEPLEFAVRYEHFDDDDMASDSQTWSVEDRYSAGARYAFYNSVETGLTTYVGFEYRHTDYRVHSSQIENIEDDNDELIVRLGVTF